jgi:ABC-type transporter Mla subunit MlaD
MDDTPASRLLSWGSTMAKQVANRTAEMDETQAQEFLDVKMQDLRKVIRRINKLVGSLSDASPDEVAETLQKIMDAAAEVPALRVAMPDSVDNTAKRLQALPPEDALNQILSYLNEGDGDGEEKT